MSTTPNDGGPAFPRPGFTAEASESQEGMTLRDWFAGMALQGIYANSNDSFLTVNAMEAEKKGETTTGETYCRLAYETADEMLKARER